MATGIQITSGGAIQIVPGPIAKTIEVCPSDDTLIATFDNIGVDPGLFCACLGTGGLKYHTFTDISVNGSFELDKTVETGGLKQWEGAGGDLHVKRYDDNVCQTFLNECDCIGVSRIVVQCVRRAEEPFTLRSILYYIPFFDVCLPSWGILDLLIFKNDTEFVFSGVQYLEGAIDYGAPDDNAVLCSTSSGGIGFGASKGGTVTFARGG